MGSRVLFCLVALAACGEKGSPAPAAVGVDGGGADGDAASKDGGGGGGVVGSDGGVPPFDGAVPPPPAATCPLPPLADVSRPTATIGDGTPASCTEAATVAAVAAGGVVVFRCGTAPVTITLTRPLSVTKDLVLDGGGTVTLSGGGTTRIASIDSAFDQIKPAVVVQNLTITKGRTRDVDNTKSVSTGGAAIYRLGGSLTVRRCAFIDNHGPVTGQDVAGGAVSSQGVGETLIADSVFSGN